MAKLGLSTKTKSRFLSRKSRFLTVITPGGRRFRFETDNKDPVDDSWWHWILDPHVIGGSFPGVERPYVPKLSKRTRAVVHISVDERQLEVGIPVARITAQGVDEVAAGP